MQQILNEGVFTRASKNIINQNFAQLAAGFTPGNLIYCDPSATNVQGQDGSQQKPFTSLPAAYSAGRSGENDVILLVGNGAASGSARLSENLTWAKDALHLVGVSSGVNLSNRSRIAPTSGATAFANFFTVSGNGCLFSNIGLFQGFGTGTTSQICATVTGGRNLFENCHIAGMGDDASAQSAGSRSLKISGTGENMFVNCVIGLDTVTRTQANASVEFAGATPRNQFIKCVFPFQGSAAGVLGILGTGNGCVDRFQYFDECMFINNVKSTSTTMTALLSFTTASPGGLVLFDRCTIVGVTKWGDTNGLANSYVNQGAPTQASSGIAVNPT